MRRSANPQDVLRSLAGLKRDSFVGFLPVIPSNPKAEHALHDLRAIALRFLDMEFLSAIRPSHSEPAHMLDAGIDVIGYAAFVQSRYREYPGIHGNLGALHEYLLNTPEPDIVNYDLQAFLVTLRAAREVMPAFQNSTRSLIRSMEISIETQATSVREQNASIVAAQEKYLKENQDTSITTV